VAFASAMPRSLLWPFPARQCSLRPCTDLCGPSLVPVDRHTGRRAQIPRC